MTAGGGTLLEMRTEPDGWLAGWLASWPLGTCSIMWPRVKERTRCDDQVPFVNFVGGVG